MIARATRTVLPIVKASLCFCTKVRRSSPASGSSISRVLESATLLLI